MSIPTPIPVPSYLSSEQDYALLAQRESLFAPHARLAFEVLEKLGEGGMGAVYKVRDKRLGRLAALKVLANEKADQNAQTRFLREARVTARLDHPSIPPVHEAGRTAGGELYMLMRLIQGQTLSQKIRDLHDQYCPQSGLTELLQALVKVAEAISYAHSQGIVHRDLKPDNIMIGAFGEVLVLDWGIASVSGIKDQGEGLDLADSSLAEISGLTQAGSFLGTPGYAAPEQIDGDPIDGRTDVFALGLLLTEVLTGQAAISGDTGMDRARATASGSISRPREILSHIPRELDWIAAQATAVDREDRTSTAREFTNQLQSYLTSAPIPSYPYNLSEKITRGARRHPLLLLGLLMGALTLSLAILLQNALRESSTKTS
jgi:serine/threonine protein kinase